MEWVTGTQRRAIAAAASMTFLATATGYAQAQQAPDNQNSAPDKTATLPAVKVQGTAAGDTEGFVAHRTATATKTDTPLDEVPQTVNIVTAAQIEEQGATSINQALRYVPGFSSYGASTRSDWYTAIRGFTPSVFVDGLQVPNTLTGEGRLGIDLTFESMDDFSPAAIARRVEPLNRLLEARGHLANLLTYMDGKVDAEALVARLLADPALMRTLCATPNADASSADEAAAGTSASGADADAAAQPDA